MSALPETWDEEVDLLVAGSGIAGLSAALIASANGLDVHLCEKTDRIGGTTAMSGGAAWLPGNRHSRDFVPDDDIARSRTYLESELAGAPGSVVRDAFLQSAAAAIDALEDASDIRFRAYRYAPDYHGENPGAAKGGRALGPHAFDGRRLGRYFELVRKPPPYQMLFGGMMFARDDIDPLRRPFSSFASFLHVLRLLLRYLRDRISYSRGTRLTMGNALVAAGLASLIRRGVTFDTCAPVTRLFVIEGKVVGAAIRRNGATHTIRTRRGVILATGGFPGNAELRAELLDGLDVRYNAAASESEGDGLSLARRAGGADDFAHDTGGYWFPVSVHRTADGTERLFPHILGRAYPGVIAVDAKGCRFTDEACSYHDFVIAMQRKGAARPVGRTYLVCDARALWRYGLGHVLPYSRVRPSLIEDGYIRRGTTLAHLAEQLDIPPAALERTVELHNLSAAAGKDALFGRGETEKGRADGDPHHRPNPCLGPIDRAPFYAVELHPAPLTTCAGIAVDADARVLDRAGQAIAGLYACGSDMSSIFRGFYVGPGATIGPSIVFAYRAIMHAAAMKPGPAG